MPGRFPFMPTRYRILLADDQPESRERMRSLVSGEHDVVGEVADGAAVAEQVRDLHPDIVLMDVSMPEVSGFGALRQLLRERQRVKVLFVSQHNAQRYVEAAREAGAAGYVLKNKLNAKLLAAVTQVGAGGAFVTP
jgi:DNA-binding NarL/FixJ family response regulator